MLTACQVNKEKTMKENNKYSFFVGTYTDGDSRGIYKYLLEDDGGLAPIGLVAESDNPSFLAMSADKKYLLAVNEINNQGTIRSYQIFDDSLIFINKSKTGGEHPCFVAVNKAGIVLTANYTSGTVGLLGLDLNGVLTTILDVEHHNGRGTTERQKSPHAHSAWFSTIENEVISVDLGTNELWFSKIDYEKFILLPLDQQKLKMAPGAGPRHLVFHPNKNWLYVVNELDCTVTMVQRTENGLYEISTTISSLPEEYSEPNTCADIHISSDGNFVYASNRGHNSIAIFAVNKTDGSLELIGHEFVKGDGPRNFSLSPDEKYLIVANQNTNNLVSFQRDKKTGLLSYVSQTEAPTPVCILF